MQARWFSIRTTRWVVACFLLALGTAIAGPLIAPSATQIICSSVGQVKLVVVGGDGEVAEVKGMASAADCALCTMPALLPPPPGAPPASAMPLARALQPIEAARIASITGAPLPARGPPLNA